MKTLLIPVLVLLLVGFSGCSDKEHTGLGIVQRLHDNISVAIAYDTVCQGARTVTAPDETLQQNIVLGDQLMAGEVSFLNPDFSDVMVRRILDDRRRNKTEQAQKNLEEKGCESSKARSAQGLLQYFKTTAPEDIKDKIVRKFEEGGAILHSK